MTDITAEELMQVQKALTPKVKCELEPRVRRFKARGWVVGGCPEVNKKTFS